MAAASYEHLVHLLADDTTPADRLHAAAVELREAFVRSEHLVGLLPGDAPEVMVAGFERAASAGLVEAHLDLGRLFARGVAPWAPYPDPDLARSIAHDRAADELGSRVGAIRWVSGAYFARDDDEAPAAAARLSELHASDPEDAEVLLLLGYFLSQGYGYAADPAAAIGYFTAADQRGNPHAAFELSVIHATGQGVPKDVDAGHRWTLRAAELGSDRAQANLGGMYATGTGVEKDVATAVTWYLRAAESGNARAGFVAGVMLLRGDEGLAVDEAAAGRAFARADELGWDVDGSLAGMGLRRPD